MILGENIIGKRISAELQKQGKSQKWLAEQIGCTEVCMTRYINGTRIPKATTLGNIAKALHVDANFLLGITVKITNADRIRSMSDEELAGFLFSDDYYIDCTTCKEPENEYGTCIGKCENELLRWLKSEVWCE